MSTEIELKLLLPGADPKTIADKLAKHPALARQVHDVLWLDNRYFDTPSLTLREQRAALRLRRVGERWIQTLKTAGVSQGGLSQRGEWEADVASGELDRTALDDTPWATTMDPSGELFDQLEPCFNTHCQRTTWHVQHADGTLVEVALDVGGIEAGGHSLPLLELELELVEGPPDALFEIARALAQHMTVLPYDASKAERGYALAEGLIHAPVRARPIRLNAHIPPALAAQATLSEMFDQFTRNLAGLCHSNDPELVHQARVGWRRWRSAARLFRPWLPALPDRNGLRPLLDALGRLRDLDVVRTETLPHWTNAYLAHDAAGRAKDIKKAHALLETACQAERETVREALRQPANGQALLGFTEWLYRLPALAPHGSAPAHWARTRLNKLQRRLKKSLEAAYEPEATEQIQHNTRLLAKRTRYSIEALTGLIPKPQAKRWARAATDVQTRIGTDRDLKQAAHLLHLCGAAPTLVAFFQGAAAGQNEAKPH